jgi:hypothetical protein
LTLAVFLHLFPSFVFATHLAFFAFAMFAPFYIVIFLFKISLMSTFDFVNKNFSVCFFPLFVLHAIGGGFLAEIFTCLTTSCCYVDVYLLPENTRLQMEININ